MKLAIVSRHAQTRARKRHAVNTRDALESAARARDGWSGRAEAAAPTSCQQQTRGVWGARPQWALPRVSRAAPTHAKHARTEHSFSLGPVLAAGDALPRRCARCGGETCFFKINVSEAVLLTSAGDCAKDQRDCSGLC